ncbi:hypothetical protein [Actinoplanes friuliensis]|uniref:hypothetical protein n=1 Tax=Actinoplanes friuliensis TaxID=196914 RepID=UPI0011DD04EC|nr:hypothetical protein [Actinoplanes friuliensis]
MSKARPGEGRTKGSPILPAGQQRPVPHRSDPGRQRRAGVSAVVDSVVGFAGHPFAVPHRFHHVQPGQLPVRHGLRARTCSFGRLVRPGSWLGLGCRRAAQSEEFHELIAVGAG